MRVSKLVRSFSDLVALILLIGFFYFGCAGPLLRPLGFSLLQSKSSGAHKLQYLWCVGLGALRHAGSQFPDLGSNLRPLHCMVDP